MGKQMQVYVRIFPLQKRDWKYIQISKDLKDIYIQSSALSSSHLQLIESFAGKPVDNFVKFQTSGVFDNNTQEELYKVISKDIFAKIFNGGNIIIMANGQHGSGKSFTMTGYTGSFENRGVALRLVDDLLNEIDQRKHQLHTEIYISHVDFAAKTIIDLLTEPASNLSNFNEAKKVRMKNKEQLVKAIILSEKRRWIEGISSHCSTGVLTIYLKCRSRVKSEPYDYFPRIQLVELSGVEADHGSSNSCQRKANKDMAAMSLHLTSKNSAGLTRSFSKLVCFLAETWNNSLIRIISHLKPTLEKSSLNMSTLVFTNRLMQRPMYNLSFQRINNPDNSLHYALEMIQHLEEELLVREMITGDGFRHVGTVSKKEMDTILNACTEFLEGRLSIELLLSLAHPHLLIRAFKKKFEGIQLIKESSHLLNTLNMPAGPPPQKSDRVAKISVVSRKRIGLAKKGRSSLEGQAEAISSLSDEMQMIEPKQPQDLPNRQTIETEFFTRYPDLKAQLDLAEDNYQNSLKNRNEIYMDYERLKKEATEEKTLEEDIVWKKRLELGECVGHEGRPVWTTYSEKPAQDALIIARKEMAETLHVFTMARDTLTDLKTHIEEKIQEYMETAYGLWTPALDADEPKACYLDKSEELMEPGEHKCQADHKVKDVFYAVQRTKHQSNPFQKKPSWI